MEEGRPASGECVVEAAEPRLKHEMFVSNVRGVDLAFQVYHLHDQIFVYVGGDDGGGFRRGADRDGARDDAREAMERRDISLLFLFFILDELMIE